MNEIQIAQKKRMGDGLKDFLKIALFDIWICNDDRNFNNYNLMLNPDKNNSFVPIDHVDIFNSGDLKHDIYTISQESSILYSPLILKLFSSKTLSDQLLIDELENYFYFCVNNCFNQINAIFDNIPTDWHVNNLQIIDILSDKLFSDNWKKECFNTFTEYIQLSINKT